MSKLTRMLINRGKVEPHQQNKEDNIIEFNEQVPQKGIIGLEEYKKANGNHFNCMLSDYASSKLSSSRWNTSNLLEYITNEELCIDIDSKCYTLGDLSYLSNWIYSNLYPNIVCSLVECINMANCILSYSMRNEGMESHFNPFRSWIDMNMDICSDIDLNNYL